MCVGVGEGPETIVVLLTGRIPERELHPLAVGFGVTYVILEYRRDIYLVAIHVG
jgi:hypothetical protein